MFLSTLLIIFLLSLNSGIPSAQASLVGSSCSYNGIIEKHGNKLVCMCNGKEVGPNQYCQKGMIFSTQDGLLEITINKGNNSPEQPINAQKTESPAYKPITKPPARPVAVQARPVAANRSIQSIDEKTLVKTLPLECTLEMTQFFQRNSIYPGIQ